MPPALRVGDEPDVKSPTPPDRLTHCVCGRKKLPFAGYSVVKEPPKAPGAHRARPPAAAELAEPKPRPTPFGQPPAPPNSPGGEYRARTGDLLVANQALSQLS